MSNPTISNTLYHFTGFGGGAGKSHAEAFETLLAILSSSHLKLSKNEITWGFADDSGKKVAGISFSPYMTCFTETPLEFAKGHSRDFGKFGIGFKIEWVIGHGGQNVVYVKDGSVNKLGNAISRMLTHLSIDKLSPDFPRKLMHEIIYTTENMDWRHEREWRIISDTAGTSAFKVTDIDCVVCPKPHASKLADFIRAKKELAGLESRIRTAGAD